MASRFTQYGGVAGADQALQQMVAERIAAQMEQRKAAIEAYKLQQEDARIGQGDRRMDIDQSQFGQTHGLNVEKFGQEKAEFAAGEPERTARTGYIRTQTRDLEQKPMYQDADRAHDENLAKLQGRIRSGHIAQQAQVDAAQGGGAGWSIQQVSDPKTNTTKLMRVNSRTGEAQPINLPDGLQPGGQRQARLTAGQQDELATMKTVEDMADQAKALGDKLNWTGVGGFGSGSISQFAAKNLGRGSAEEETLRNLVGNIQGTIAKLRGGTSFTVNEQKLLESYTPTINDSDLTIKAKITSLKNYIATKRQNTLQFAGADMGAAPEQPQQGGVNLEALRQQYGY